MKYTIPTIIILVLLGCKSNETLYPNQESCVISSRTLNYTNGLYSNTNDINFDVLGDYFYNSQGYLEKTIPNEFSRGYTTYYFYDSDGFLMKKNTILVGIYNIGNMPAPVDTSIATFKYNSKKLLSNFFYHDDGSNTDVNTNIIYDSNNKVLKISRDFGGKLLGGMTSFEYNYISGNIINYSISTPNGNYKVDYVTNSAGLVTKEDFGNNVYNLYTYNSDNSLIQTNMYYLGEKTFTINYEYDKKKNLKRANPQFKGVIIPLNLSEIQKSLTTLNQNNLLSIETLYKGNVQSKKKYSYQYNKSGFPISIESTVTYPETNKSSERSVKEIISYNCK